MVAYHCLHSVPRSRPHMRDVVAALEACRRAATCPLGLSSTPSPAAAVVVSQDDEKASSDEADSAKPAAAVEDGEEVRRVGGARGRGSSVSGSPRQSWDRGA
uniref:Uncharacterized protein n=1 Tax=Oryza nivara TaxID=4536 RepID=A0A0E0IQS2_ORYNI